MRTALSALTTVVILQQPNVSWLGVSQQILRCDRFKHLQSCTQVAGILLQQLTARKACARAPLAQLLGMAIALQAAAHPWPPQQRPLAVEAEAPASASYASAARAARIHESQQATTHQRKLWRVGDARLD